MNAITTILEFGSSKHCFLERTASYQHGSKRNTSDNDEIMVYELKTGDNRIAFFSLPGKYGELVSGDTVQMNGLFAEKLSLKHGDPLMLKRIKSPLSPARKVNVEPMSPDDWEILEQNSGRVETVLLDQIRVVWPDQVFPVWIQRSICVFMKITAVEPMSYCLLLENNTEVIVSPKTRVYNPPKSLGLSGMPNMQGFGSQNRSQPTRTPTPSRQPATATPTMVKSWFQEEQKSCSNENLDTLEPRPCVRSPSRSPRPSLKKTVNRKRGSYSDPFVERQPKPPPSQRPMLRRESSLMESVVKYVFSFMEKKDDYDTRSESDTSSGIDFSSQNLPSRSGVLRVQPMKLSRSIDEFAPTLSSSMSNKRGKWQMLRNNLDYNDEEKSTPFMPYELFQPSTVYLDADSTKIERELHPFLPRLPNNFIARLQRLPSPQEKAEASQKGAKKSKDTQDKNQSAGPVTINNPTAFSKLSNDKSSTGQPPAEKGGDKKSDQDVEANINASCFVRVVVIDRKAALTDEAWKDATDMLLTEQPLMIGHVIVPDLLRRQLKLDATGSVWLQTGTIDIVIPKKVIVYHLTSVPLKITNDILEKAFRAYIKMCADVDHPLILFQGLFLKYPVFVDLSVEVQVTFFGENDLANLSAVTMLGEQNIDSVLVNVERNTKMDKMGVVNPTLGYTKASDFDTQPPTVKLKHLGGTEKVAKLGLSFLQVCVGSRPLSRDTFKPRKGLSHGSLLITGPRGSGKSSLAKALCRKMSQIPTMAHITLVDCKSLRGKTVSHIQKILESVFDEAAWREPSIIVFDNLDVITPASSGPEGEMNAEALYAARNSQVLQGLIKYEMENNSSLALIVTAASKNSLHSSLVSHNGVHFFQVTLNIGSPNKEIREKILTCVLQQHSSVSNETIKTVDLRLIASKTEGYVARDMEVLVNRAIHYRLSREREVYTEKITLSQNDFDVAQEGFKPVSIRGVALHKAGDLGWADVGGLDDVKKALVETLLWPAKYPRLFSSCPIRQRSGTLLYGAPGTGKTLLAGVVARKCGLNFISIKGPELLSKYIGASEQAVRDIFTRATSAKPCILFFDEFDSIAPKRGHDSTGVTDRVVNQFLTQLDGVEGLDGVYVLAATSRPDLIDSALLRPGRLDKCLQCTIPTEEERYYILEALTRKMCLGPDVELIEIASMCHFFTGADIKALLYNAQLKAIHENAKVEPRLDDSVLRIKGDDECCPAIRQATQLFKEDFHSKLSKLRGERTPTEKESPIKINTLGDRKASGTSEESTSSEATAENKFTYPTTDDVSETLINSLNNVLSAEKPDVINDGVQEIVHEPLVSQSHNVTSRGITTSVGFDVMDGFWPEPDEDEHDGYLEDEGFDNTDGIVSPVSDGSKSSDRSNSWIPMTSSPVQSKKIGDVGEMTSPILPENDNRDGMNREELKGFWEQDASGDFLPSLKIHSPEIEEEDDDEKTLITNYTGKSMRVSSSMNLPDPSLTYPPHSKRKRSYERTQSIPASSLDSTDSKLSLAVEKPVTVFTSLEHGLATLSPEDEARYLSMVQEIRRRDDRLFEAANDKRRTSLMITKRTSNVLTEVCQCHLLQAARELRPSVSVTERRKYDTIYNKFVSSRSSKPTHDKVDAPPVQKRATLA